MGKRQAVGAQLDLAEQQQVDVDRPGTVAWAAEGAPALSLDRLADVEQLLGIQCGADADGCVEEVRLVEDLADGLGLVERRDRLDRYTMLAEGLNRRPQLRLAVADIGAEAEVAGPQTPSSSSGSRSIDRSRVTSTPASCTG
jgi:hypothetical protein